MFRQDIQQCEPSATSVGPWPLPTTRTEPFPPTPRLSRPNSCSTANVRCSAEPINTHLRVRRLQKSLESISRDAVIRVIRAHHVQPQLVNAIMTLYINTEAVVLTPDIPSDSCTIWHSAGPLWGSLLESAKWMSIKGTKCCGPIRVDLRRFLRNTPPTYFPPVNDVKADPHGLGWNLKCLKNSRRLHWRGTQQNSLLAEILTKAKVTGIL